MKLTEEDKSELRKTLRLSPRQIDVVEAIFSGIVRDREIADHLALSTRYVKALLHEIYGKGNVGSKVELVLVLGELLWARRCS